MWGVFHVILTTRRSLAAMWMTKIESRRSSAIGRISLRVSRWDWYGTWFLRCMIATNGVCNGGSRGCFPPFSGLSPGSVLEHDKVPTHDCVVKSCCGSTGDCAECKAFTSVFDGQRYTDQVAMANRSHLYERVGKGLYSSFVQIKTKKWTCLNVF